MLRRPLEGSIPFWRFRGGKHPYTYAFPYLSVGRRKPQQHTAGHQHAEARADGKQVSGLRGRLNHLFEIVEEEQELAVAQRRRQERRWRPIAPHAHTSALTVPTLREA